MPYYNFTVGTMSVTPPNLEPFMTDILIATNYVAVGPGTITIHFHASGNATMEYNFYIDNVSLKKQP